VARWRLDGLRLFERMVNYDLLAASLTQLKGHEQGPLY
jgi:hypothetical protein